VDRRRVILQRALHLDVLLELAPVLLELAPVLLELAPVHF
jgi:hypothetical protein